MDNFVSNTRSDTTPSLGSLGDLQAKPLPDYIRAYRIGGPAADISECTLLLAKMFSEWARPFVCLQFDFKHIFSSADHNDVDDGYASRDVHLTLPQAMHRERVCHTFKFFFYGGSGQCALLLNRGIIEGGQRSGGEWNTILFPVWTEYRKSASANGCFLNVQFV